MAAVVAAIIVVFSGQQIVKISNSLAEQRATAFILEKRSETITQLKEDFKLVGDADKKIENAFPPADNVLEFVAALETLANQNGVSQGLSFSAPVEGSVDYTIAIGGHIFILINYLKNFEKIPYFSAISSVSLNAPGGWEGNSTISLKAKVYTR